MKKHPFKGGTPVAVQPQKVKAFRCPRWEELPGIPLYMDQVIMVIEQALALFYDPKNKEKLITPAMVNNYVKHGLLWPPNKKKYEKKHVAALIVISLMKKNLNINEIVVLMKALAEELGEAEGYNLFCVRLEEALERVFLKEKKPVFTLWQDEGLLSALNGALTGLMAKLYVQDYIEKYLTEDNKEPKSK